MSSATNFMFMKSVQEFVDSAPEDGFNIVELIVTIAVMTVLIVTIGSALGSVRPNSLTAQCLNNLKQLAQAFLMYAEDNNGNLVPNRDGGNAGKSSPDAAWVGGWMDYSANTDNTNTDLLINHKRYPFGAYFGPYTQDASLFKCPADKSVVTLFGQRMERVRTFSLNNFFGKLGRTWTSPSNYNLYTKMNQIGVASSLFTFVDEHPNSVNDGWFPVDPDTPYQLIDYPGSSHEGAGNLVFADGHGETHRWLDSRTTPQIRAGVTYSLNVNLPGDVDIAWLQQHASEHK